MEVTEQHEIVRGFVAYLNFAQYFHCLVLFEYLVSRKSKAKPLIFCKMTTTTITTTLLAVLKVKEIIEWRETEVLVYHKMSLAFVQL